MEITLTFMLASLCVFVCVVSSLKPSIFLSRFRHAQLLIFND